MATMQANIVADFPQDWKIITLFEVADNYDNKRKPIKALDREKIKGNYPYCGANGIVDYINMYALDGEYVLVAEDGGYWGKGENTAYIMNGKFFVNNHAHILSARNGITVNHFLQLMLNHLNIDPLIGGDARGKLTKSVLMNLPFPLPPFAEQKAISQILTTIQDAITSQERLIAKLKELKQSMMHHLFTKGTKGEKTKMTEIGEIPESWDVVELGEACKFTRGPFGGSLKKEIFVKDGIAIYEQSHAIHGNLNEFRYFINYTKFEEMQRFEVNENDLIMSCSGTFGKIQIIPKIHKKGIINQALLKLTPLKTAPQYLKLMLESSIFQSQLRTNILGVAIQNVAAVSVLKNLKIAIPSKIEQAAIVNIIKSFDQKIENVDRKLMLYQNLFKTVLDELMSGKRRINNDI